MEIFVVVVCSQLGPRMKIILCWSRLRFVCECDPWTM